MESDQGETDDDGDGLNQDAAPEQQESYEDGDGDVKLKQEVSDEEWIAGGCLARVAPVARKLPNDKQASSQHRGVSRKCVPGCMQSYVNVTANIMRCVCMEQ